METYMETYTDENGNRHIAETKIGGDAQGNLFRIRGGGFVLCDAHGGERLRERFDEARILDLGHIESLAMPSMYLKGPRAGYLAPVPDGMVPVSEIMAPADDDKGFYNKTGGLRRRVQLLAELAKTLHMLHSVPCMYGEISPLRLFVSENPGDANIRLLYSAGIGASMPFSPIWDSEPEPEGMTETSRQPEPGPDGWLRGIHSDARAFGAFAQDLLTHGGRRLELGEVLGDVKAMLASAQGADIARRPSMAEAHRLLLQHLDLLLTCQKCGNGFVYQGKACPLCQSALPKVMKARIYDKIGGRQVERGAKIIEFAMDVQHSFWNHHTEHVLFRAASEPRLVCMLKMASAKKLHFIIKSMMDKNIAVGGKPLAPGQSTAVALPCEVIRISFPLHSEVRRCIDMVIE